MRYITPTREELIKFTTNVKCVITGCSKRLSTTSSLRFHLIFGHKINKSDPIITQNCPCLSDKESKCRYYCPDANCKFNAVNGKSIASLRSAKSHYISCHVEKKHACPRCQMLFATEKKKVYHMRDCGVKFICSCNIAYSGRQGLLLHLRRSNHKVPKNFLHLFKNKEKLKPGSAILPKGGNTVKVLNIGPTLATLPKTILLQPINVTTPVHILQFAPFKPATVAGTNTVKTKEMSVQTDQQPLTVITHNSSNAQITNKNKHSTNGFVCMKCGSQFLTKRELNLHIHNCGIQFVCSCNIAYAGKYGLMSHIKRSKHKVPERFKYLFERKKVKKSEDQIPTKKRKFYNSSQKQFKQIVPKATIPVSANLTQTGSGHVQPRHDNIALNPAQMNITVANTAEMAVQTGINTAANMIPPKKRIGHIEPNLTLASNSVQAVINRANTAEMSVQTCKNTMNNTSSTQTVLDELVKELENAIGVINNSCQTIDWMTNTNQEENRNHHIGEWESRGMQTDVFDDYDGLFMPSMSTQTYDFDFMNYEFSSSMTQTDHSGELLELLEAGSSTQKTTDSSINTNNNSNSLMDDISTQTQAYPYSSTGNDYLDMLNSNATQTDFITSSPSSQTGHCDRFLTDFLNIETQTDNSSF